MNDQYRNHANGCLDDYEHPGACRTEWTEPPVEVNLPSILEAIGFVVLDEDDITAMLHQHNMRRVH